MTATPETAPVLPAPLGRRRAVIGRETISTASGVVVGYDLRFSGSAGVPLDELDDAAAYEAEQLACHLVVQAFGQLGLERLGQRRHLYVNVPRPLLVGAVPLPFGPEHVVVQVLPDVVVDDAVLDGLRSIKGDGYRLAVDSGCAGDAIEDLYPHIDVLRVAVPEADAALPDLVAYVRGIVPTARLLADALPSAEVADAARAAGFELLQGVEPDRPAPRATVPGRQKVVPSQVVSLQLLAALCDPQSSADDLERIISVDPGLSIRVLGAVNSAAGTGREVGNLRQALVLLGRRTLGTWVLLAAFGGEAGNREQMVTVLTRARTCELLTPQAGLDANTAYTAGLLSAVVDVLGADASQVAREARLQPDLTTALVQRQGAVGRLVRAVEEYDRSGTTGEQIATEDVSRARLHALGDAVAAVDAVLGPV